MSTSSSDESFLARWSRLKRQPADARLQDEAEAPQSDDVAHSQELAMRAPAESEDGAASPGGEKAHDGDAQAVRDFSDFEFEKLDYESDYTQFMGKDVPQDARNKALRRLWVSNPVLANMDGLDDYCEDYTDAAVVPVGVLKTAYKVGRGFMSDEEVAEWEKLGRPDEPEVAGAAEEEEAPPQAVDAGDSGEDPSTAAVADAGDDELIDAAACPGAACAASVKQEEQAALDAYDAERKGADGGAPDHVSGQQADRPANDGEAS